MILNYRIDFGKKTFINSNYPLEALINQYSLGRNEDIKLLKMKNKLQKHFYCLE
jgi:hypothetical protein